MLVPHQSYLWRSRWYIRWKFDFWPGAACFEFSIVSCFPMHPFSSGCQSIRGCSLRYALDAIFSAFWQSHFLFCQYKHWSRCLLCYLAAHDGALVLVSSSIVPTDILCLAFLISHNSVRFLSALLAMTGTGNFIFARVLLSKLTSEHHASAASVPTLRHRLI